jgi:hypothetical protein
MFMSFPGIFIDFTENDEIRSGTTVFFYISRTSARASACPAGARGAVRKVRTVTIGTGRRIFGRQICGPDSSAEAVSFQDPASSASFTTSILKSAASAAIAPIVIQIGASIAPITPKVRGISR